MTLAVLLLGQFMGLLDVCVVNVAIPSIGAGLHASGASLQMVVGGYTMAYAMLLITGARLGELHGRRRIFQLGVITFTLASLICGFAPNITVLIIFRFVQGTGAAVMVPQIISVIQTQFTGKARTTALSAYGVVLCSGSVAGMVLGGVLVDANLFDATWRPVFLINVPIGLCLALLVPRFVPPDQLPRSTRRLDVRGLVVATASVFLVVLPLVLGHQIGWPAWTYASIAAGLLLAVLFVRVERQVAAGGGDPLLALEVLRSPGIVAGLATLACMAVTYGGLLFVFTLHLQEGLGYGALRTGLIYVPYASTTGLAAYYWRRVPEQVQYLIAPVALATCAAGYLLLAAAMHSAGAGALMWVALVVTGIGQGFTLSPVIAQSLVRVPLHRAADTSGLLSTNLQLASVLGVAVFGTEFLSMDKPSGAHTSAAGASASALSTTLTFGLAVLAVIGVAAGTALARTVRQAKLQTAQKEATARPSAT